LDGRAKPLTKTAINVMPQDIFFSLRRDAKDIGQQ
jgi:hypothetical protein